MSWIEVFMKIVYAACCFLGLYRYIKAYQNDSEWYLFSGVFLALGGWLLFFLTPWFL